MTKAQSTNNVVPVVAQESVTAIYVADSILIGVMPVPVRVLGNVTGATAAVKTVMKIVASVMVPAV